MNAQETLDRLTQVMKEALFINPPVLVEPPRKDVGTQYDPTDSFWWDEPVSTYVSDSDDPFWQWSEQ